MNEIKIVVEGLNELTEAVRLLAAAMGGQTAGKAMQADAAAGTPMPMQVPAPASMPAAQPVPVQAPVSASASMPAPGSIPVQAPLQGQVPVTAQGYMPQQQSMPVMPPQSLPGEQITAGAAPALPTTAVAQEYTLEQLQVAAAGLSGMGRMPQVLGILQRFGIQAMTELPREKYGEFAAALREAGAQV